MKRFCLNASLTALILAPLVATAVATAALATPTNAGNTKTTHSVTATEAVDATDTAATTTTTEPADTTTINSNTGFTTPTTLQNSGTSTQNTIRSTYRKLREEYNTSVESYKTNKQSLLEVRETYIKSRNSENLKKFGKASGEHILKTIEVISKHLELLKTRVTGSKIGEEAKAKLIADIDEDLEWLADQKTLVEASEDDTTTLKTLLENIKSHWETIRIHHKQIVGQLLVANFEKFATHLEQLSERLREFVVEQGNDSETATNLIAQADGEIVNALTKYEEAKSKFDQINSLDNVQTMFTEGHTLLKEAKEYLKTAHRFLRQAVQIVKVDSSVDVELPVPVPTTEVKN